MKKVNLGSGPSGLNNWINLDYGMLPWLNKWPFLRQIAVKFRLLDKKYYVKWPKIVIFNLKNGLPFENNSVDFIYCSHVLEHFEKWEARKILLESKRVLKEGGVIRVVLPDIEKVIKSYDGTEADKLCRIWWGYDKDIEAKGIFAKISRYFIRGHQWMYDKLSFKKMLKECGYGNIKLLSIGKGRVPEIDKLDLKLHENLSFYYEAEK